VRVGGRGVLAAGVAAQSAEQIVNEAFPEGVNVMKRSLIAALVLAGVVWYAPGAVSAHTPVVTGQAVCQDDGTYRVNWTATSDVDRDKEWRLDLGIGQTPWQADEVPFKWSTISPGTSTVAVVNIRADFRPDGPTDVTAKGTVPLAGDCVAPTTTTPPTTTPPTTVPETTVPVTTTPIGDVCHLNGSTDTIPKGGFVFYDSSNDPRAVGTHSISGIPCGPAAATGTTSPTGPPPDAVSSPALPATGGETGWIALVALVTLLTGISVVATVRRA
jgi:hypothetical protein